MAQPLGPLHVSLHPEYRTRNVPAVVRGRMLTVHGPSQPALSVSADTPTRLEALIGRS